MDRDVEILARIRNLEAMMNKHDLLNAERFARLEERCKDIPEMHIEQKALAKQLNKLDSKVAIISGGAAVVVSALASFFRGH